MENCQICKYSHEQDGNLLCRRFPPQVVMFPTKEYNGYNQLVEFTIPVAFFSMIAPDDWCGEFAVNKDT